MQRFSKISPLLKKAALGVGVVGFTYFAYATYNKKSKLDEIISKDSQSGEFHILNQQQRRLGQLLSADKVNEKLENTLKQGEVHGVPTENKQQAKQQHHHHHDMDIRVLDMVGFPAVDGANILEEEENGSKQQHPKQQSKQQQPQPQQKQQQQKQQQQKFTEQKLSQQISTPKQILVQKGEQQNIQKPKPQSKPFSRKIDYKTISDIPKFDPKHQFANDEYVLIVIDMPYTSAFEKQIITKLSNTVKRRRSKAPLSIYRADTNDPKIKKILVDKFGASIEEQTILLMKNPHENKFTNFDFDLYISHANLPTIYLSQLRIAQTQQEIQKQLTKMTPNDSYLLYLIDFQNEADLPHKKLAAKYIQMELGVNNMENIRLLVVDEKIAKDLGIISPQTKSNSIHLIRKNNQFTYKPANRYLFSSKLPYNIIQSIAFYDKSRNVMIPKYLSKIETFNSIGIQSPYACSITIDRNKISPKEEREILKVFSKLKQEDEFPGVSFVLKFSETEYRGEKQEPFANKKWVIKLANLDGLEKQLMMHDIKNIEDTQTLGISEQNWLRDSYQYLYKEPQVTQEGLRNFINRCLQGQQPQFFKSQAKFKLQSVNKLTGQSFNQVIFNQRTNKSHLVFEYSDHCHTCQILSPLMEHFNEVCKKFPNIATQVHAINCDKNRVKGLQYSPYTPNLYYYSKKWKNTQPMKYPILEYIGHTNLWGIYDFCTITEQLKPINEQKFQDHIKQVTQTQIELSDF